MRLFTTLIILLLLLALASCAAPPRKTPSGAAVDTPQEPGYGAERPEDVDLERLRLQLRGAELLLESNYPQQAKQVLDDIDASRLTPELQLHKTLLDIEAESHWLPADRTLAKLERLADRVAQATTDDVRRFLELRARALGQLGDALGEAEQRIQLDTLLDQDNAIIGNQAAIMQALRQLSVDQLQTVQQRSPPVLNGWLELAAIVKNSENRDQLSRALSDWRTRRSQHPASNELLSDLLEQLPEAFVMPQRIALILPLEGRFAQPANAVLEGFLAAYYADSANPRRPLIRSYLEPDDGNNIHNVYQQAVRDGAEFIIGPLDKNAVNALAAQPALPVPTLALNYADNLLALPERFYQMSLSPEQEARQVAERAWQDGRRRALLLSPDSAWGDRMNSAFVERWRELGGEVVEQGRYDATETDYAVALRTLLNLDESSRRQQQLRSLLNIDLNVTPRRRQDADFIFVAAFARQARLIRPQLKFHHASDLAVYSTSHVYDGYRQNQDRDMDGLSFVDMPWTIGRAPEPPLKAAIKSYWPESSQQYVRLYALGIDAYQVIGSLHRLRRDPIAVFPGMTGELYMDEHNRLLRRLQWAEFRGGVPQPLAQHSALPPTLAQ